jgi:hypothetical protein
MTKSEQMRAFDTHAPIKSEAGDQRCVQLLALFEALDERGKIMVLAMIAASAKLCQRS